MNVPFLNVVISWILVGLIWVIQLVHYPSFTHVNPSNFLNFHQHHTQSITLIVMPLMLGELGLGIYLAQHHHWNYFYLIPLVVVGLIWLSTFAIQVPIHNALGISKEDALIHKLVQTNWIRTLLWTVKALWVSYYFIRIPDKL